MQSLTWYLWRFQGMSSGEIVWRIKSAARDVADRYRFAIGFYPSLMDVFPVKNTDKTAYGFSVSDVRPGEWTSSGPMRNEVE